MARKSILYLQTPFDEQGGDFSPDGRWMAYQSNESGQFQIYVQAIPASGAKVPDLDQPRNPGELARDGKQLYIDGRAGRVRYKRPDRYAARVVRGCRHGRGRHPLRLRRAERRHTRWPAFPAQLNRLGNIPTIWDS
ncbi:MAG: hypothetical protein EXQ56_14115 [Acidobacteria bacterium]|nr:hypothetical protein [Acidobacteriota bacterium]